MLPLTSSMPSGTVLGRRLDQTHPQSFLSYWCTPDAAQSPIAINDGSDGGDPWIEVFTNFQVCKIGPQAPSHQRCILHDRFIYLRGGKHVLDYK